MSSWYLWLFPAVVLLWAVYWLVVTLLLGPWSERGQFGDMFGSVNALFSGLAFVGIIIAIFFQRDELRLQRTELELQREVLKQTRDELRQSALAQWRLVTSQRASALMNARATLMQHFASGTRANTAEYQKQFTRLVATVEALEEDLTNGSSG